MNKHLYLFFDMKRSFHQQSIRKSTRRIRKVGYVDDKTDQRNGKESSWHGMAGRQTLTEYV
ncbi:hypothetical protein NC651_020910 [Populus alba x Populus x berolinensis]|nr:hypothetical protein NC651_020910 [Populus alba x Populus x berolinensis]